MLSFASITANNAYSVIIFYIVSFWDLLTDEFCIYNLFLCLRLNETMIF